MSGTKSGVSRNTADPVEQFKNLSVQEQKDIADRLLRIEQSGWKPFWCPYPDCTGDPHALLLDALGNVCVVADGASAGPAGEPVGDLYEDELTGEQRVILDLKKVTELDTWVARVALEPQWAHNHARADQRLPSWKKPWTLFIMSGRGAGKTRTGVEFVTLSARKGLDGAIIGRRGTELENTHVAEILANAHPEFMPTYYASKAILVWPNGATTYLFSAERPENIRSVNLSYFWFDEAAFMDQIETAWMNATLATRIETPGNPIHKLITSTPTSTPWVMKMEDDEEIEVRRVATYANKANLSADYIKDLRKEYEGTRMGRQELYGEVLRDVEGALWNDDIIQHLSFADRPVEFLSFLETLDDVVIGVDPAGSKKARADLTGIIAVGVQHTDDDGTPLPTSRYYVLGDGTIKGSPTEWARQAFQMARLYGASQIVVEKNFGADMVLQVMKGFAKEYPGEVINAEGENMADLLKETHAVQGKETRAEGTVGKYEQGRVTHVNNSTAFGDLSSLEQEQVTWVPKSRGGRMPSPNRVDALVWAIRALDNGVKFSAQAVTQSRVRSLLKRTPAVTSKQGQALRGRGAVGPTVKRVPRAARAVKRR